MFLRELRKIARPHWFDILFTIKRSSGLSVSKLAKTMKMSYMGVKQHCDDLEKLGYLDTWRQPRKKGSSGRPEKLYRVTARANVFFPTFDNEFTSSLLVSLKEGFGGNAPEKLVFAYLSQKGIAYRDAIEGVSLQERAVSFAAIRNREGFLCICEDHPEGIQILEYHHPLHEIFEKHPATVRMEQSMLEMALGCSVTRKAVTLSGMTCTTIHLLER